MQSGRSEASVRALRIALLLSGLLLLFGTLAQPDAARAGSYLTFICHDDSGIAMPADLASQLNSGPYPPDYFRVSNTCAAGGRGQLSLEVGGCPGCRFGALGVSSFLVAPSGETIAGYGMRFTTATAPCTIGDGHCASGQGEVFATDAQHQAPNYAFLTTGQGLGGPFEIGGSGLSAGYLQFYAGCDTQHGTCAASNTVAGLYISLARAVFDDHTTPQVLGVGGSLVAGQPVSGTQAVNYSAQDTGGGIFAQHAYVDGAPFATSPVDTNGGRCVDHGTVPGMHSFGFVQPCRANVTATLALDTTRLSDGVHTLRIDVEDAAGDRAVVYNGPLNVANGPLGAANALALSLGVAPQGSGDDAAGAGAACVPMASGSLAPGPGSTAQLTVQLTCGGHALAGTPVTVADNRGFLRRLSTNSTGVLHLTVPHRQARLSLAVGSQRIDLAGRLRAITLAISPRVTRNGGSMRWRGMVANARPGMKLLLEVRRGSAWTIFDQATVGRDGRFHYRYTFHATRGTVRYTFRVVARDGSARSPARSILVRG